MALVPQVVDAVNIPVIAAGGIADGRGMAALLCLVLKAIQMGTIFVASKESIVSDAYKNKVIKARDIDTKGNWKNNRTSGKMFKKSADKRVLKVRAGRSFFLKNLKSLRLGGLRKAVVDGDVIHGSVMAGQIAGLVKTAEVVKKLSKESVRR